MIIIFLDHSSFPAWAVKALTHTGYREKKTSCGWVKVETQLDEVVWGGITWHRENER